MSVADLTETVTDEYLDFCEKALVRPKDEKMAAERNLLDDYFPIAAGAATENNNRHEEVPSYHEVTAMRLNEDDAEKAVLPGESYTIFDARDVLGTQPEEYEIVVRRASGWAGVEEEYMCRVVEKYERRVVRWWEREKRTHVVG